MRMHFATKHIRRVVAGLAGLALVATALVQGPSAHADGPYINNLCLSKPDLVMRSITINPNNTATFRFRNNYCSTGSPFVITAMFIYPTPTAAVRTEVTHPAMAANTDSELTLPFSAGALSVQVWLDHSQTDANSAVREVDDGGNNYMSKQIGGPIVLPFPLP
jgi:hypothetical protein